ncbi:MAG: TetR/AcrR family transcriptional regulator [Saprospiraceae bacterium]|nr:TetR/AcrR family transcriptional regulator [Saprospiraceae bacterium]
MKDNIVLKSRNLFLKYGIKSVAMDDIARELGISKKTLYQHFETKNDIIKMVAEYNLANDSKMVAQIQATAKDAIDEMFLVASHVIDEIRSIQSPTLIFDLQKYHPELWQLFEHFQNQQIANHIKQNIERGIKEGLYRPELNALIISKIYAGSSLCVIDEKMFPQKEFDKIQLFKEFFVYHIRGLATTKGLKLLEKRLESL